MGPNQWEKERIHALVKDAHYGIDSLTKDYGLRTNEVWHEAFDNAGWRRVEYIKSGDNKLFAFVSAHIYPSG